MKLIVQARNIILCNTAGSLLQGGPKTVEGKTYIGNEARKKGIQMVDLIHVLNVYFKGKKFRDD